jgi:malate synthase
VSETQLSLQVVNSMRITAEISGTYQEILTPQAMEFVSDLERNFSWIRKELLQRRHIRQMKLDSGEMPDFLPETAHVRNTSWTVSPNPTDLQDRRVEITGPAGDTKMVINAFNSSASTFMADFEDAQSPTWNNVIQGQINLRDAIRRKISYTSPDGKEYSLNGKTAVLIVRPRSWHLDERHFWVDGQPMSASLFDFGLFLFHNAKELLNRETGPYFYLPKLESYLEARLWNDVFDYSEDKLGLKRGTIRATVLIETILASFEMDEILYELREHCAGLNCGRWDYIFSFIKKFSKDPKFALPDRAQITMDKSFLAAYVSLLIKTCHMRGVHAIGGMAAQIPIKNDEEANRIAFEKVRLDKLREVKAGHDGTWVAHPGLVAVAKKVFDEYMPQSNQVSSIKQSDAAITQKELLDVPEGNITLTGFNTNISVGLRYLEAWIGGKGAVPINNLMEDAATAEISRAQLWQWVHHKTRLASGELVTLDMYQSHLRKELKRIRNEMGHRAYFESNFDLAAELFQEQVNAQEFPEFLTSLAYETLMRLEGNSIQHDFVHTAIWTPSE